MFLLPSPLEQIQHSLLDEKKLKLWIKRDDLIHPDISGNKWRKLNHFFKEAENRKISTLVSFGGAWSNHIYSLAAAGKINGFQTVGIIRGEEPLHYSSTLLFALQQGMKLHFVSRETYRDKKKLENTFREKYPDALFIPEGGANELGTVGCERIVEEIEPLAPHFIAVACGTATTMMGIAKAAKNSRILGFSALKNGDFLLDEWQDFIEKNKIHNLQIINEFSGAGYAKSSLELEDFIVSFYRKHAIKLEPIYTGKMMLGIFSLIAQDFFSENTEILAIHTGGLQGLQGFPSLNERLNAMG